MVTDFGVAKALSDASLSASTGISTTIGIARGTPAYMAPEQVAADPMLDGQADVYSLGTLAYELLAGHPVFGLLSPQAVMAAHIAEVPRPIERERPETPRALAALVMQCLAKAPGDRPTSSELVKRLDDVLLSNAQPHGRWKMPWPNRRRARVWVSALA